MRKADTTLASSGNSPGTRMVRGRFHYSGPMLHHGTAFVNKSGHELAETLDARHSLGVELQWMLVPVRTYLGLGIVDARARKVCINGLK